MIWRKPVFWLLLLLAAILGSLATYAVRLWLAERTILDREEVASVLLDAIDSYYADHSEYPPLLHGDLDTPMHRFTDNPRQAADWLWYESGGSFPLSARVSGFMSLSPDPLLDGGYLRHYPLAIADYGCGPANWRWQVRWRCAVSTPNTYVIELENGEQVDWGALYNAVRRNEWNERQRRLSLKAEDLPPVGEVINPRLYSLAAYEWSTVDSATPTASQLDVAYTFHPLPVPSSMPVESLPYFGYQRGEWLGTDPQEAWLWFYGLAKHYEGDGSAGKPMARWKPMGLDLISCDTGEIQPDGTADGICLLYKLKNGEIAEVIRAGDLGPSPSKRGRD